MGEKTFPPLLESAYLSDPKVVNVLETLLAGDVVYDDDGVGSFIVGPSDGSETFLSCSVPNLQLDHFPLDRQGSLWWVFYLKRKSTPMVAR